MSDTNTGSTSERLNRYLTSDEDVEKATQGSNRIFAVTDSRVIDISEGKTSTGRPTEFVQSTIFNNVTKVDVSVKETITVVNTLRRVIAAIIAMTGLLFLISGAAINSGDISSILLVLGIVLIAVGVWLWITATEESPGGIMIEVYHTTPQEESKAVYKLPEDQSETAKAVVRMAA